MAAKLAPNSDNSATFKLLLVGDSSTGKSSLLLRFTEDQFDSEMNSTIGVDCKVNTVELGGVKYKLKIWDTTGQTLTSSYYRGAQGVILVYDVTRRETFTHLEQWLSELSACTPSKDVVKMIVGNKVDKESERVVTKEEGAEFARKLQTSFIECSAKTRVGVKQTFEELVQKIADTPALWQRSAATTTQLSHMSDTVATAAPKPLCYANFLERLNENQLAPGFLTIEGLAAFNALQIGQILHFRWNGNDIRVEVKKTSKVVLTIGRTEADTPSGLLRRFTRKEHTNAWRRIKTIEGQTLYELRKRLRRRMIDEIYQELDRMNPPPYHKGCLVQDGKFYISIETEMTQTDFIKVSQANPLLKSKYIKIIHDVQPVVRLDKGPIVQEGAGVFADGLIVGTVGAFLENPKDPNKRVYGLTAAHVYEHVTTGKSVSIAHPEDLTMHIPARNLDDALILS